MRTACLISFDKVVKSAFNLSRGRCFPFLLENQIVTGKGLWEPEVSGRVVRTAFYVTRVTIWEEQFFLKEKKRFFLCFFPTFCRNLSKFRILFGRLGKRFRDCGWNFTPLVQTKILVGKTFCRISHVYKLLAVGLKNPEILWRKFSVRLSQLHLKF